MTGTKKKNPKQQPILINDLYSLYELRAIQRQKISDYINTTYGGLDGFMNHCFEESLLQPIEPSEAVEVYYNSAYVTAEVNADKTEVYIILSDDDFQSFRLFMCGKDTLSDTEETFFTMSKRFRCSWEKIAEDAPFIH
ncbi:MAG: hypothetical protein K5921_01100 [Lachnospiraceae bacterium]|nr:hypothetical protein [Lachnospiraceae bacterium]